MTTLHIAACAAALAAGALVFSAKKGTRLHRRVGWIYVASTVVYALSSFGIPTQDGGFTFFHAISLQSLILVTLGVAANRLGPIRWRAWHIRTMAFSYVALVATGLRFTLPVLGIGRLGPLLIFSVFPAVAWLSIERRFVRSLRRST